MSFEPRFPHGSNRSTVDPSALSPLGRAALTVCLVVTLVAAALAPAQAAHEGPAEPNDPLFEPNQWGPQQIRAEQAWHRSTGAGTVIGIVDSGIDLDHEDLASKVIPGATFLECPGNPAEGCGNGDWESGPASRLADKSTHGTHVAGIAAAATNNLTGLAGIAPDAKLLAVKVIDEQGGTSEDIAAGIRYAVDHGADVINLSIGISIGGLAPAPFIFDDPTIQAAIDYANSQDVVIAAASGNEFSPLCADPAAASGGLCVTATDRREAKASYANAPLDETLLAVAAPGGELTTIAVCEEGIISSVPAGTGDTVCGYPSNAAYGENVGTSMAAPHVAGVAALLKGQGCTRQETIDLILDTARQPRTNVRGLFTPTHGWGIVDAAEATLQAAAVCDPPVANVPPVANDDTASTSEDTGVTVPVLANDTDADGDALSVSAVTQPASGTAVNNGDGTISYTPDLNFNGTDTFGYTTSDGRDADNATVSISVGPVPDPPVAVDDTGVFETDTPLAIEVLANDSDPDGDALEVTTVSQPANGTATTDGTSVTYTPDLGFNQTDTFTYTVSDGQGTATARVDVFGQACLGRYFDDIEGDPFERGWTTDLAANNNPVTTIWSPLDDLLAESPTQSWFSDTASQLKKDDRLIAPAQAISPSTHLIFFHRYKFTGGFDGGVLEVSTDGGATWVDVVDAGGSFIEGGYNGSITATPAQGSPFDTGRRVWTSFSRFIDAMNRVEVDLGSLAGETALFRWRLGLAQVIAIGDLGTSWNIDNVEFTNVLQSERCPFEPVNQAPDAVDDSAFTQEDTAVTVPVLSNDSDPDGDPVNVIGTSQPTNGAVVDNEDGTVTYTPDTGFYGTDTFTYTISDSHGATDTATVTVTVNGRPIATPDSATTKKETPVVINVTSNDSDPEGDPLTLTSFSQGAHGAVTCDAAGTCTYSPEDKFKGTDSFGYEVCDPQGGCDRTVVTVAVGVKDDDDDDDDSDDDDSDDDDSDDVSGTGQSDGGDTAGDSKEQVFLL